jgi:GNAT superfamily N-acetyltransferase
MQFREACTEDAEAACEAVRRSITDLCHADHRGDGFTLALWLANKTAEDMRRWLNEHFTLVATRGGAICGVGMIASSGEVLLNYVSPDARFRGVSKGIIARLEGHARELGVGTVILQSSTTARQFYYGVGYRETGRPTKGFGVTLCHPMAKEVTGTT